MSDLKQPGQRAYEAWCASHGRDPIWLGLHPLDQCAWKAAEQVSKAQLFELADEWLKRAVAIRAGEGVVAAAEALEDCADELLAVLPASPTKEPTND